MMHWREVNFDGLVGPTHNYAGLSFGNVASTDHQGEASNPRQAALQGLEKMRWLMDRGFYQGILPPQIRPNLTVLKRLGFRGSPAEILSDAWEQCPQIFSMCCSASSMWAANAATVIPSCDSRKKRCIFIPANLVSNVHRSLEVEATTSLLNHIFGDKNHFCIADPLPSLPAFADEGAANHMRIALPTQPAINIFVYGRQSNDPVVSGHFPARQTHEACSAQIRLGGLDAGRCMLVQQNPFAIDRGVFHNDVIAVSHDGVLLCHEKAFMDQKLVLEKLNNISNGEVNMVEVAESDVPLDDAISGYLFNSQILGSSENRLMLLPIECKYNERIRCYVEKSLRNALNLQEIAYLDLQQSMRNGGGPACLRLRVTLNDLEIKALRGRVLLNDEIYMQLVEFVQRRYPETFTLSQLACWDVAQDMISIVQDLHEILGIPLHASHLLE